MKRLAVILSALVGSALVGFAAPREDLDVTLFRIRGVEMTSSAAELNVLAGANTTGTMVAAYASSQVSSNDLVKLHAITSTAANVDAQVGYAASAGIDQADATRVAGLTNTYAQINTAATFISNVTGTVAQVNALFSRTVVTTVTNVVGVGSNVVCTYNGAGLLLGATGP